MDAIRNCFNKALFDFGIDRMINNADRIIVAFSGGADSRVLLSLMREYTLAHGKQLMCAHLNHMIRGEDAFRDENNCVKWAQECGVPIRVCRVDVPAAAEKNGKGIEETARNERYKFFDSLASELDGTSLIATAHNADDNLETVIFNLLRGSGTRGMTGIPPVRDGKYIRPLILCRSAAIRNFCKNNGIEYNVDSTNNDTYYTRNYIRKTIVPLLGHVSCEPADAVLRMCSVLRTDDDFISSFADDYIAENGSGPQSLSRLNSLHNAILSRVIDRLYRNAGGLRALSKSHVDSITDAVRNKQGTVYLNLPDGVVFYRSGNTVSFGQGNHTAEKIMGTASISTDGKPFVCEDFAVTATTDPVPSLVINENIYNLSIHILTNFDKIKDDFFVRGRMDGDTYKFGGMTRKVKKLFSEKKIPSEKRDNIPLVLDKDGIVWIPGFPLRDGSSSVNSENRCTVYLCYYEKKK